jgi:3-hydroxybutyryl-CoA dehydrogenase
MKKIGIVGTGIMGCGIAQVASQIGCEVIFQNRKQESVDRGLTRIQWGLDKLVSREKLSQIENEAIMGRIRGAVSLEELKDCDIILESAPEDIELKRDLLETLSGIASDRCIIATNTSSLSVTKLASFVTPPERFIGMHFFNPVQHMNLVEVVSGLRTSNGTTSAVCEFARALGKTPIEVMDLPGFVVNRVLFPMINEAAFALNEGVSDAEGIDACMKSGCNHPMGPLELADLVGLDIVLAILKSLHREYGNPRYAPCLEIVKRVEAGWLGRKSGRGFYNYRK